MILRSQSGTAKSACPVNSGERVVAGHGFIRATEAQYARGFRRWVSQLRRR